MFAFACHLSCSQYGGLLNKIWGLVFWGTAEDYALWPQTTWECRLVVRNFLGRLFLGDFGFSLHPESRLNKQVFLLFFCLVVFF